MSDPTLAWKKTLVGLIALACAGTAAGMWFFTANPEKDLFLSAVTRVGFVMGALWLALPARGESVAWSRAIPIVVAALVAAVLLRRAFIYFVPIAAGLALLAVLLKPRIKRHQSRR